MFALKKSFMSILCCQKALYNIGEGRLPLLVQQMCGENFAAKYYRSKQTLLCLMIIKDKIIKEKRMTLFVVHGQSGWPRRVTLLDVPSKQLKERGNSFFIFVQTSRLKASRPGSQRGEEKWICGKKSFPWCDWKSSRTKRGDSPEPRHPLCPLCHSWLVNRNFVSGPESAHWGVGTPHTSRNTPHTTSLPRLHFLSSSPISFQTGPVLAWRINRFTRPLTN